MRKHALLLLLSVVTNLLLAQNNPFVKGYMVRADPMYTIHNFRQTSDHGFIMSTDHILSGPDAAGITTYGYLIKLDSAGQPQWTTRYPKIACYHPPQDAAAVAQATDGGYAIATTQYYCSGNFQGRGVILLIKTDSAGTISWSKSFSGPGTCSANCVEPTSDNGFIVAGSTRDTATHEVCYFMIKTDSVGQVQWQKTYNSSVAGSVYGIFYGVIQTHDGGYAACGHGLDTCNYGSIMRMDANGDLIWCRKTPGVLSYCFDIQETNDHQYIVSGTGTLGQQVHRMYKLDDLGNTIWAQEIITFPSTQDQLTSVVVEDDGYTFAGSCDTGFQQTAIIHTDTSGNVMWYHTFPQVYPTMNPSITLADSGYAYNATCPTNGANGWFIGQEVIKTDQQGWSSCVLQTPPYTVNALPPLHPLTVIAVTQNYPVGSPDIVSQLVNLSDTTFCPSSTTGITEPLLTSSNLFVYPNPTNGNAVLQLPQDGEIYKVTVYNKLGELVYMPEQTTGFTIELPTAALAPGMYVVCATNENGVGLYARLVKTE